MPLEFNHVPAGRVVQKSPASGDYQITWPEALPETTQFVSVTPAGEMVLATPGGSGASIEEVPSGAINGVNDTFTLSQVPVSNSLLLVLRGLIRRRGVSNDYTLSGSTITFNAGAIPQTGDVLFVNYRV